MSSATLLFVGATALVGLLAAIGIRFPHRLWIRAAALGIAMLFLPLAYASQVELLSRPKPVAMEWLQGGAAEATVLGSSIRENEGIYLWLQLPGTPEPRAYVLPWSRQTAEQLQKASREAQQSDTAVKMRQPFEPGLDDLESPFYAPPQPAPAPKEVLEPGPERYQPPARTG